MGYDGTLKFDTSIDNSGFQSGISKISSIAGSALKATTAILAGTATAVAGIGTAAIKVGAEFDSAMSKVEAISGAAGDELQQLRDKAIEMGDKTKYSATESAEAFTYMAMAGWKTEAMLDGIEGVMNLAAASGEDLATTSDIVTDALTAFGLAASDASHFSDVLAQTAASANTDVSLMGESFKYVGTMAGSLGYSIEDVSQAIGLMANSGLKGTMAGTSLNAILTRLSTNTGNARDAIEELGVSFFDEAGNARNLGKVMEELREATKDMNDEQKTSLANTVAGITGQKGLLAILNATDDEYYSLAEAIENADGAAEAMAETMNDNLSGQLTILKGQLETFGIMLVDDVQEPLKDVVKEAQSMVSALKEAYTEDGLGGLVTATGEVLADVVTQIAEAAPTLIETALDLCQSFIGAIMENSDAFASAGAELITTLVNAILQFAGSLWSAGIVLFRKLLEGIAGNASEIGATAAEMISQIASAFVENLPLIIQAGRDIVTGFFEGMSEEFPGVSALLEGFFEGFIDTIGSAIEGIVDILSAIFEVINNADPDTMESVGKAIGTIAASIALLNVASKVVGSVQTLFSVLGTLKTGVTGLTGIIGKVVEGFALWSGGAGTFGEVLALQFPKIAAFGTKIGSLVSTVSGAFSSIVSFVSGIASKVAGFFSTFGTTIAGIGSIIAGAILAVTNFVDMFVNGFDTVKEVLMVVGIALVAVGAVILGAPVLIAAAIAGIVAAVATLVIVIKDHWEQIVEFFQGIPEKIGEVIDAIVTFFSELPGKIWTWLTNVVTNIVEWGAQLYENACLVVSSAVDAIVQFFTDLPYKIGYAIGYVLGTLAQWALNVIEWITTNVPLIIDSIVTFFSELPGKIWTWLTNAFDNLVTWGANMLQKAGEVAQNCVESISTFFSELPGKVLNWLSNTWSNFKTWGSNMLSTAKTAASNVINSVVNFFSQLPGKIWTWLTNTVSKVVQWGSDMVSKAKSAASDLVNGVISTVSSLPSKMMEVGSNIVSGVWNGIKGAAGQFMSNVKSFFSGIVDGAKSALGIRSPSKVFAEEVGKWIPPGIGEGIDKNMPDLASETEDELDKLVRKMQATVSVETGKIELEKTATQTYKVEKENGQSFDDSKTEVNISGEIHTHVELDGEEVGNSTTPIIDRNMGRIDTHKKRGG